MKQQNRLELSDNLTGQQIQDDFRHSRVVSLDLWHLRINKGNEAYYLNDPVKALRYFKQALEIADNLLLLSIQQGSNPAAALTAMSQSLRNLTEIYLSYDLPEEAISAREAFFYLLVEIAPETFYKNTSFSGAYLSAIDQELDLLLTLYYAIGAEQDVISTAMITAQNVRHTEY